MGRQNGNTVPAGVQYIYMSLQRIYAVGVQNNGFFHCFENITHQTRQVFGTSQSRSQCQSVTVFHLFGNDRQGFTVELDTVRSADGERHGRGTFHRFHRPYPRRNAHGNQSTPGMNRCGSGEKRCAGVSCGTANDQHFAEVALMGIGFTRRERMTDKGRFHGLVRGNQCFLQITGNANVTDAHISGIQRAGSYGMTGFHKREGNGFISLHSASGNVTGIGTNAAGDVHGDHCTV